MNYLNTNAPAIHFRKTINSEIYIDFSRMPDFCESYKEYIVNIIEMIKEDLTQAYPVLRDKKYSMLSKMFQDTGDSYFGFQEEEVKKLCDRFQTVSYEELKKWYDGYYTSDGRSLFNPCSVSNALSNGLCRNYWTETGPMNEVADCIEHNVDEVREDIVKMVSGILVPVKLKGYSAAEQQLNSRDEILSAMVVYGFLSYHDGFIKIPNHELMEKFEEVLSRKSMGAVRDIVQKSREMLTATLKEDAERVAEILEEVHDREIPFLKYHDENALSCVITLCYLYARDEYWIEREYATGKGYCDYIFIPKKSANPAIILELKYNHSAKEAIQRLLLFRLR